VRLPRSLLLGVAGATALAALTLAREAAAHKAGLSSGTYRLRGAAVAAELTFERAELAELMPRADTDGDRALGDLELSAAHAELDARVVARTVVRADGAACPGTLDGVGHDGTDGVVVRATFVCPARPRRIGLVAAFLDGLPPGHRHLATLEGGGTLTDAVLHGGSPGVSHQVGPGADGPAASTAPADASGGPGFVELVKLGVEHILTGYDHLVFLLGLVLLGGRARSLAWVVTAFTLGHSITLGAAALGLWTPSPRVVEPLIAASVAYVGVENFFVKDAERRWRVTLPFGLVHGFGFAGALAEARLAPGQVPRALLGFNLGVELGQAIVLAPVLPLVLWLRRRAWFTRWGVRAISGAIAAAGLAWLALRVARP